MKNCLKFGKKSNEFTFRPNKSYPIEACIEADKRAEASFVATWLVGSHEHRSTIFLSLATPAPRCQRSILIWTSCSVYLQFKRTTESTQDRDSISALCCKLENTYPRDQKWQSASPLHFGSPLAFRSNCHFPELISRDDL